MIQYNYKLNWTAGDQGFESKLNKILQALCMRPASKQANAIFIQLSFHNMGMEMAEKIREKIREFLPRAVVAGMTEMLFNPEGTTSYVSINCAFFQKAKVRLLEYDGVPEDFGRLGLEMGQKVAAMHDVRAAMILGVMAPKLSEFIDNFVVGNENVVVFGGIAGMYEDAIEDAALNSTLFSLDPGNKEANQFVYGSRPMRRGIVVVVFSGESLSVRGDYTLGWKPLGKEMTITETVGYSGISKLDGMPAVDIYRHYLKVKPDEHFLQNIVEFPLVIDRNGCLIARVPPEFDEEGRIFFTGDVRVGERVRLSYAVQEDFLHETELASEKMSQFAPEALYLNICGTRSMFLQDKAQLENIYYHRSASQLNACSGTGEIYYYQGQGGILNCALVAVGFREGNSKSALTIYETPTEAEDNAPVLLSVRMAAFLDAVTQELEETNRELRQMAMEAEKASIDKYRFLSSASRDIAEPLQKVMEMERRVLQESNEPHIKAYAAEGRKAGEVVHGIIQRLFDFLEMEAGNFKLNEGEYRLDHLLDSLREELAEEAVEKGISLNLELEGKVPSVLYGDELRLRQILLNLLGNGLKYTLQGAVTLQIKAEKIGAAETMLTVRVKDTGIGMTEEQQAELQNILAMNVDKKASTLDDTGIGISVSQRLLNLMGSKLEISSKLGVGSEVSFVLHQRVLSWIPLRRGESVTAKVQQEEKETISLEELAETWDALREIADACERESLDYMLENLEAYVLPEREAGLLLELRTAAQEENWGLIQKLLQ